MNIAIIAAITSNLQAQCVATNRSGNRSQTKVDNRIVGDARRDFAKKTLQSISFLQEQMSAVILRNDTGYELCPNTNFGGTVRLYKDGSGLLHPTTARADNHVVPSVKVKRHQPGRSQVFHTMLHLAAFATRQFYLTRIDNGIASLDAKLDDHFNVMRAEFRDVIDQLPTYEDKLRASLERFDSALADADTGNWPIEGPKILRERLNSVLGNISMWGGINVPLKLQAELQGLAMRVSLQCLRWARQHESTKLETTVTRELCLLAKKSCWTLVEFHQNATRGEILLARADITSFVHVLRICKAVAHRNIGSKQSFIGFTDGLPLPFDVLSATTFNLADGPERARLQKQLGISDLSIPTEYLRCFANEEIWQDYSANMEAVTGAKMEF